MNAKNYDLFFNENSSEVATITLSDEDGNSIDTEIVATLEIEDFDKEYVVALPTEPNALFEEGEVILLIYSEDADGNPEFTPIEDEEEFELVSDALEQLLEDEDDEDEEDDITDENYLDDIPELFPGVSIKQN